jgi:hypothetical protein
MRTLEIGKAVKNLKIKENKVALGTIALYVDGAIEQWERIQRDQASAHEAYAESRLHLSHGENDKIDQFMNQYWGFEHQTLLDLHFYSICGDKIFQLMNLIVGREKNRDLEKLWNRWREKTFEGVNALRVKFEHPHLYLERGWNEAYFGLYLDELRLTLQGKKFDLKPFAPKEIANFFDELIEHLQAVSREST